MSTAYTKRYTRLNKYDVIIIGGGAAGMFAAVTASSSGHKVLLLEKNKRLGIKLSITGKGRCNVTNNCTVNEVLHNIPRNSRFLFSVMDRYTPEDIIQFFEAHNVPLKTERGNRVFPVSDSARDIVKALTDALESSGTTVIKETVKELLVEDNQVIGVKSFAHSWYADKVILATGGLSYPRTGSTGDGYHLAKSLGHNITPLSGSLVPLEFDDPDCMQLNGLDLKNVGVKLWGKKKKPIYSDFGEASFTEYGASGPIILSTSCHIPDNAEELFVEFDLKPALDRDQLDRRILRDFAERSNEAIASCLRGLLPAKIISVILSRAGIMPQKPVHSISKTERTAILNCIKALRFKLSGKRPVEEAIITRGGIKISEINPKTMESKLVKGLYFAGEIIDCDAYTGGFNLQIAWSTAFAAAKSFDYE